MKILILAIVLKSLCALCLGCSYGDLRLNGTTSFEGRIELCFNSTWRSVCHDQLDWQGDNGTTAAKVACRQLGFSDQGDS